MNFVILMVLSDCMYVVNPKIESPLINLDGQSFVVTFSKFRLAQFSVNTMRYDVSKSMFSCIRRIKQKYSRVTLIIKINWR